ncbi:TadE family protein [Agromyces badenianii]|uniref:TadE family protein n=1 Tax=Agromyces badenianii TaxID=2080742 RepID=UPI00196AFA8D|nr:TadE family protein [Agromyces badenianii]
MRRSKCSTDRPGSILDRPRSFPDRARFSSDEGSASLEFLTVGIILLVPLVYLVLAVAAIQGGALAVEGAARQAARVAVQAIDSGAADAAVERAVRVTLDDYGVDADAASVTVSCAPSGDCLAAGERVRVSVTASVQLPLVPAVLSLDQATSVPLEASATQTVSRFAASSGGSSGSGGSASSGGSGP